MTRKDFVHDFIVGAAWPTLPAKKLFRAKKQINIEMIESHRLALTMAGVVDRPLDDLEGLQSSDYSTYQIFNTGDLVFKLIDLQNIKTSRVGYVPRRGIMSPVYIRLVPGYRSTNVRYYYWYFFSAYLNNMFNGLGGGVRQSLAAAELLNFPVPVPPIIDQAAIVAFLDRETARIGALIEKKQRLIELLQEKCQTIITQAVTKGLDPSVPMKDSEIGWVGQVPEHWQIVHIKRVFEKSEYGISASLNEADGVAVLRMGNLKDGEISLDNLAFVERVQDSLLLQPDDLLFNRTNSLDLVGRVGIFRGSHFPVTFASYLVRFEARPNIDKDYLCFLLNQPSVLAVARSMALPAIGQANLNPNRYGYMRVCKPPFEEQEKIANMLNEMRDKNNEIIDRTEVSINLLKERRSALITAAVTGQIDVRGKEA